MLHVRPGVRLEASEVYCRVHSQLHCLRFKLLFQRSFTQNGKPSAWNGVEDSRKSIQEHIISLLMLEPAHGHKMWSRIAIGRSGPICQAADQRNLNRVVNSHQLISWNSEVLRHVFDHAIEKADDLLGFGIKMAVQPFPQARMAGVMGQKRAGENGLTQKYSGAAVQKWPRQHSHQIQIHSS